MNFYNFIYKNISIYFHLKKAMANQESNNPEPWNNLEGKVILINHPAFSGSPLNPNTTVRAVAVEFDVTADDPTIDASVHKAWDGFGRIDVLINNVGFRGTVKNSLELDEEEWGEGMKTNLNGTWLVSKHVCRRMRDGHQGGLWPQNCFLFFKYYANYTWLPQNWVNAISPGLFKSEITEGLLQKSWLNNVTLKMVPLQTFGTLDPAVTSLVRFLVHDSSRYITGNILIVDAGSSLPVSQFSLPFEFYFCFRSLVLGLGPSPFPTGIKRDHWCLSGLQYIGSLFPLLIHSYLLSDYQFFFALLFSL
ncbi:unnamed protein product, partial [Vitis vinifera]